MSVNPQSAASRSFVALPPQINSMTAPMFSKRTNMLMGVVVTILVYAMPAAGLAWMLLRNSDRTVLGFRAGPFVAIAVFGFIGFVLVGFLAWAWRHNHRKIVICVTSDGLTVNQQPAEVFSFSDATLGPWQRGAFQLGSALHLQCGPHRLVLGGRDHRIGTSTRLDAPPADNVDAWLWASDFDEVLTMAARRSALDDRRPAPDQPARCLLYPNIQLAQTGFWAQFRAQRISKDLGRGQPLLALDLAADAIRVIDPSTNEVLASASPAQMTATREAVEIRQGPKIYGGGPILVVGAPDWQPLTITSSYLGEDRFSWRGDVKQAAKPADYDVNATDWLMLVEKFGMTPYLEDTRQG